MYEFDAVSVSSFEAASLAAKLSEKSAEGWEVVAIVPAGSDVTAFLKRASPDAVAPAVTETEAEAAPTTTGAVTEPAGWGTAPAASGSSWGSTSSTDSGSSGSWGSTAAAGTAGAETASGWGATQGAAAQTTPTTPVTPATPSVPAGWYHDPAGRFELRYWDGSAWTEHVSRAGQQYTDPPVA